MKSLTKNEYELGVCYLMNFFAKIYFIALRSRRKRIYFFNMILVMICNKSASLNQYIMSPLIDKPKKIPL